MRRIVDDLDGCRRSLFEEATTKIEASHEPADRQEFVNQDERRELARWRGLARYQPAVVDFLKAQVLIAEKRYPEALAALELITMVHLVRLGPFLQTADLYLRLGSWRKARQVYEKALVIDPDHAQATHRFVPNSSAAAEVQRRGALGCRSA